MGELAGSAGQMQSVAPIENIPILESWRLARILVCLKGGSVTPCEKSLYPRSLEAWQDLLVTVLDRLKGRAVAPL